MLPNDPINIDPALQQILHGLQSLLNIVGLIATVVILPLMRRYGGRVQLPQLPTPLPQGKPDEDDDDDYSKMLTQEIIKRVDEVRALIVDKSVHTDKRFETLEASITERFQRVRERLDAQERRILIIEGAMKSEN